MSDRNYDDAMAEIYRDDPAYAVSLLNQILDDPAATQGEMLRTLRRMAKAFGGVASVARKAELNPTQLYRTLSAEGNPEVRSLVAILKAMGLRLAVQRIEPAAAKAEKVKPRKKRIPAAA